MIWELFCHVFWAIIYFFFQKMDTKNEFTTHTVQFSDDIHIIPQHYLPTIRKRKYYDPKNRGKIGVLTDIDVEKDIEELIDSETVEPVFKPTPDISDILSWKTANHPFMRFTLKAVRKQEVDVYM